MVRLFLSLTVYLRTETLPFAVHPNAQEYTKHKDAGAKKKVCLRPLPLPRAHKFPVGPLCHPDAYSVGNWDKPAKHICPLKPLKWGRVIITY